MSHHVKCVNNHNRNAGLFYNSQVALEEMPLFCVFFFLSLSVLQKGSLVTNMSVAVGHLAKQ